MTPAVRPVNQVIRRTPPAANFSSGFDRMLVFSTLHRGITFVHLFYSYLILLTGLFPQPLNTSQSPVQHRGVVCWLCLYIASGGPTSIFLTVPMLQRCSEVWFSAHKIATNGHLERGKPMYFIGLLWLS